MFFFRQSNNKGLSLVEIMVAVAALGGLSVVMLQITKDQAGQTVKSKVVADIAQFKSQLQSTLLSPAHCQANFFGKTTATTSLTEISECSITTTGACRGTGVANSKFPVYTTNWTQTNTKISDRVRISAIGVAIQGVTATAVSTAKLTITLQTKPEAGKNTVKNETVQVAVPVIMTGNNVIGCPLSWNTTNVY
ncbi:MAG: hypothetical protein K2Q18_12365 [Bdellovibrionales bacterium]|nr:hypothetical protein [Bdellovibrionales bacterium]